MHSPLITQIIILPLCICYIVCFNLSIKSTNASCHCISRMNDRNFSYCVCVNIEGYSVDQLTDMYPDLCNQTLRSLSFNNTTRFMNTSNLMTSNCDWHKVTNLTLTNTDLTRLTPTSFAAFSNIQHLNISHNHALNGYGDKAFQPLGKSLTHLTAVSNPVRSLTREVFRGLINLQVLFLSDNKIGYMETGVFSNNCCANLRELRLDSNILTVLDTDSLVGLSRLEILDLRNNPLQQLDSAVFNPCASTLVNLRMSHDDQATFGGFQSPSPKLFSRLSRLNTLEMIELKLTNLASDVFEGLDSLKVLSLRGNRLIQLPPDVFSPLTQLKYLDLSANWLVCIPSASSPVSQADFLSGLPLSWVDLSWNRLTHLNHLTARSLSLFDRHTTSQTRLVLNLTANPWQHIDDDTFCNPDRRGITRPIELVVGPLPAIPFANWRTSFGLWLSRAMLPKGPFSLIGEGSLIKGLMLDKDYHSLLSARQSTVGYNPSEETGIYRGVKEAVDICEDLKVINNNKSKVENYSHPSAGFLAQIGMRTVSSSILTSSISSYCPRLPIRKLKDWELSELKVSSLIASVEGITRNSLSVFEQGSRLYLLVIVGVCITFLFIALTVIMCYRAWSRRTSQKLAGHDLEGCDGILTHAISAEKPLLLKYRQGYNDDNQQDGLNKLFMSNNIQQNKDHFYSNDNSVIQQLDPTNAGATTTITTTTTTTNAINTTDSTDVSQALSTNLAIPASTCDRLKASITSGRSHLNRPKSDPDSSDLTNLSQLTSLGIV
ncbi:unnamed protein product [Heterobilharzia americana]|nr:unnamed protein product [Heterobilharzia americana]